jgi:uncharacterized protein (DUF2141 family)
MKKLRILILLSFFCVSGFSQTATLIVKISNIESNKGDIKLALFNNETMEHFVYKPENAFRRETGMIKGNTATAKFIQIPYGEYAISVFHDENKDEILNRAAAGFPTEAYGFSNNPPGIAIPEYNESVFKIRTATKELDIQLKKFSLK